MRDQSALSGHIRKLRPTDQWKFREHLLRLDQNARHFRFAQNVNDSFVEDYSTHMSDQGATIYAYIEGGLVHAAAELRRFGDNWGDAAEVALSVEADYQTHGIGTALMARIVRSARNRGVKQLFLRCLTSNTKMLAIARKFNAALHFENGEVIGDIVPQVANYVSLIQEAFDDRLSDMSNAFEIARRYATAA